MLTFFRGYNLHKCATCILSNRFLLIYFQQNKNNNTTPQKNTHEEVNTLSNIVEDATSSGIYHDIIQNPPETATQAGITAAKVSVVELGKTSFVQRAFTRAAPTFISKEGHPMKPVHPRVVTPCGLTNFFCYILCHKSKIF